MPVPPLHRTILQMLPAYRSHLKSLRVAGSLNTGKSCQQIDAVVASTQSCVRSTHPAADPHVAIEDREGLERHGLQSNFEEDGVGTVFELERRPRNQFDAVSG